MMTHPPPTSLGRDDPPIAIAIAIAIVIAIAIAIAAVLLIPPSPTLPSSVKSHEDEGARQQCRI
jgi:hypothetical protein